MEPPVKKALTKDDVEQELQLKENQIEQRITALQEEVASVAPTLRDAIFNHPVVSVGGALLAGLVVGLIFGGKKRRRSAPGIDHHALVENYVDAVVEEARHRVLDGQSVDEAVQAALEDRVPLIVYESPDSGGKQGLLGTVTTLALRQVVPLAIQMGLQYLSPDAETGEAAGVKDRE